MIADFLRYAKINTRSDASSQTIPTTPGQVELALLLRDQLQSMGLNDVLYHEKNSFVIGRLAGNPDKTAVGFIAHVDTADFAAENIQPQIHENYDGKDVCLNEPLGIMMTVAEFPNLKDYIGETLITTDGTTLLGADDKAGIAEIIDALRILQTIDPQERGDVWIAFGPDEEIGKGADLFDPADFPVAFAYTMDSGRVGHMGYETFNAARIDIQINGTSVHPGTAYGRLVNALKIANQIDAALPQAEVPEKTKDYQGFYLLHNLSGHIGQAELSYIIRDHDQTLFQKRKEKMVQIIEKLNEYYGERITYQLYDQYYNMGDRIKENPQSVIIARQAMKDLGITPIEAPFRGGTDGSKITYKGIPTPNLFTGGENFHGQYEFITVEAMAKARDLIVAIVKRVAE
ncbi:peptidase T [Enterococcus gallinarum]|uniref:peptidase T n=1 Tax=Enterococcus gallinarum TaxID=1353 RepID=UPI0013772C2B|nr:peptidase T [Enterococcus gallinarum]NCE15729.1 peptidase T [Enterococcus gallinarum]